MKVVTRELIAFDCPGIELEVTLAEWFNVNLKLLQPSKAEIDVTVTVGYESEHVSSIINRILDVATSILANIDGEACGISFTTEVVEKAS